MEKLSHFLRQERERKGLSLQGVERELRIPSYYLEILEGAGDKRLLADPMYLIPSLRSYATFLDLDPAAVVTQFTVELQELQQINSRAANPKRPFPRFKQPPQRFRVLSRLAVLVLALGILAFVGQFGEMAARWQWSTDRRVSSLPSAPDASSPRAPGPSPFASLPTPPTPLPDTAQSDAMPSRREEAPLETAERQAESSVIPPPSTESLPVRSTPQAQEALADALHLLRIQAKEEVWLRVTIDAQQAKDIVLHPGQTAEWSAGTGFTLTLGNAGGVELTLDGQGLPPLGKSGQVIRNVRLPAQG